MVIHPEAGSMAVQIERAAGTMIVSCAPSPFRSSGSIARSGVPPVGTTSRTRPIVRPALVRTVSPTSSKI